MSTHEIGRIDEFPEKRGTPVEVSGVRLAVFNVDGDVYAVHDNCPHKNLPLHQIGIEKYRSGAGRKRFYGTEDMSDEQSVETRGRINCNGDDVSIECPWHSLEFDAKTGDCPVRNARIPVYPVDVDDNGTVSIEL